MKIKLTADVRGRGKCGDELEVDQQIGSMLISRGVAKALSYDPPAKGAPASIVKGKNGDDADEG